MVAKKKMNPLRRLSPDFRPLVGDIAYEVEWCSNIPVTEFGDADIDRATMHTRLFTTIDAAREFAKQIFPKDAFGSVRVTRVFFSAYDEDDAESMPHVGFWEASGDPEYYEGDCD